jgi:hypothetical protein
MTETAPITLESLKAAALAERQRLAREKQEADELEEQNRVRDWRRLMEKVTLDHPYFAAVINEQRSNFTTRDLDDVDYTRIHRDWAEVVIDVPLHEPIAMKYGRAQAGDWHQMPFARSTDRFRIATAWIIALDTKSGVESSVWEYTEDVGEALLVAEASFQDRTQKVKEAVKARDEKYATSRRPSKAKLLTHDERAMLALKDLYLELRDMVAAEEDEADELLVDSM